MKTITSILFIIQIIFCNAQNIKKMEYFVDNDPGYGLATNVALTPAFNISYDNIIINVPSLPGNHYLYIRAQHDDGAWGQTMTVPLFNSQTPPTPSITRAEFFVNTDPGIGLGTTITIPANSGTLSNISFNVPTASLTAGTDYLFVRVKDENGKWSIVHTQQLDNFVTPPTPSITRAEFFVNTDPGIGLGTTITIPANVGTLSNINFNVPTASLTAGTDYLYVRVKDENGKWSIVHTQQLDNFITPPTPSITRAEFFVNTDPGIGLGTTISIPANSGTLSNINFNVPTASLTAGTDYLYVRVKDENGKWSIVHTQQLDNFATPPSPSITRAEFFVNTDPGIGLGTTITIPANSGTLSNINFNVPTTSLTSGTDYLFVRVKDENGKWSIVHTQQLDNFVTPPTPSITRAEYFVNTDPGIGLGTTITIPANSGTLSNVSFNVPTASLTAGTDYIFVRVKDENGKWSIVHTQQLDNFVTPPTPSITRAEFFVNTDPGIGLGTTISIPANSGTLSNINFNVPTASLTAGTDYLFVRVKDENGKWSIVHTQQLDNFVTPPSPSITRAEFFVNTDPGIGLGTTITIPANSGTLSNITFNVPTASLTAGTDYLFVRVKDEAGKWSIVHTQQLDNIVTPPTPSITRAEFFVNTDPGIGLGTTISIPANSGTLNNINFNVPTASLTAGTDYLFIRVKDETGKWSIVHTQQLDNLPPVLPPSLVKAEYFIDTDPGFGLATPITLPGNSGQVSNISFNINTAPLSTGYHYLFMRVMDEKNKWSIVHIEEIYKGNNTMFTIPLDNDICSGENMDLNVFSDAVFNENQFYEVFMTSSSGEFQPRISLGTGQFLTGEIQKNITVALPTNIAASNQYRFYTNTTLRAGILSDQTSITDTCTACPLEVLNGNASGLNSLPYTINCAPAGSTITFANGITLIDLANPITINKNLSIVDMVPNNLVIHLNNGISAGFTTAQEGLNITSGTTILLENIKFTKSTGLPNLLFIKNSGTTTIKNVALQGASNTAIKQVAGSTLNVLGNCEIKL